jgi:hypothetical protein
VADHPLHEVRRVTREERGGDEARAKVVRAERLAGPISFARQATSCSARCAGRRFIGCPEEVARM